MLTRRPTLKELVEETEALITDYPEFDEWEVRCSATLQGIVDGQGETELEILGLEPDEDNQIIYLNVAIRD